MPEYEVARGRSGWGRVEIRIKTEEKTVETHLLSNTCAEKWRNKEVDMQISR